MVAQVFSPQSEDEILRCAELLQRTNQLNTSGRRHDLAAMRANCSDASKLVLAIRCSDRFGDYGIVGIVIISLGENCPLVTDFALSCRVSMKGVEHSVFEYLRQRFSNDGISQLQLEYVRTPRNGIVRDVLGEVGFVPIGEEEKMLALDLKGAGPPQPYCPC